MAQKKPPGRPRKGRDGTRVSDHRLAVYLSSEQKARLAATARVLGRSASDILAGAFDAFYRVGLTPQQRQTVEDLIGGSHEGNRLRKGQH